MTDDDLRAQAAADEWVSSISRRFSDKSFSSIGNEPCRGRYDRGAFVLYKGAVHKIAKILHCMKKDFLHKYPTSSGTCAFWLEPPGGGSLIGHLWHQDFDALTPLEVIAVAASLGEDPL